jgi:hypothetical protein
MEINTDSLRSSGHSHEDTERLLTELEFSLHVPRFSRSPFGNRVVLEPWRSAGAPARGILDVVAIKKGGIGVSRLESPRIRIAGT